MKKPIIFILVFLTIVLLRHPLFSEDIDGAVLQQFKRSFSDVKVDEFRKTDVDGMYEVVNNGRILYYLARNNYIFSGSIWSSAKVNITRERESEVFTKNAKEIPLDKGIKIGDGKDIVYEFTNPDCLYCREASKYFAQKKNVTRYVFFIPILSYGESEKKIKYIVCAKDRERAYEEVMTGRLDGKNIEVCTDGNALKFYSEQQNIIERLGISSTPQFLVNGKHVSGANIPMLERFLKKE